VERRGIVEAGRAEGEKVLCGFGDGFAEDFKLDVAFGSVQLCAVRGISLMGITGRTHGDGHGGGGGGDLGLVRGRCSRAYHLHPRRG
jgi:hypothetical protein